MRTLNNTRRRFIAHFAGLGLGSTLLPGVLWGQMNQAGQNRITAEMLKSALALSGLEFDEDARAAMVREANRSLDRYEKLRALHIPDDISPPFHFTPVVPGMVVDRTLRPFRISTVRSVNRPANLEDAAHWSVRRLAELIRSRQVTALELTRMYLGRLHRHNAQLNCVVTFLDDLGLAQAAEADREIAAGKYRGPLHGIPWGAKDIIAVKGYATTWGSGAYKDRIIETDATVVEMLREAGAVLVAKLTTGEFAHGDRHHLGQTRNPWNPSHGSSGSSAGPAAATAAGCVAFGIGTETAGSLLSPSWVCGVTTLRPTFGRVSRHGIMVLSWTQDRVGPMCRYAEDCALVMQAMARPDGRDLSVTDIPFNWDARLDVRGLRVGFLADGFENATGHIKENGRKTLDHVRALGVKLTPVDVPRFPYYTAALSVEKAVFHSEFFLSSRHQQMARPDLAAGFRAPRLISAVDYLVSQRARTMMMMKLSDATVDVDVWLSIGTHSKAGVIEESDGPTQWHSEMANLAGYPALAVPNGLNEAGTPTSITIYGRPFADGKVLALGKACQDAAGFHRQHPKLPA
ncbi:MAG: amidase [Verrucomicrobia bacterium]|nr:amidase [Verrucomicrobiota bacterium]